MDKKNLLKQAALFLEELSSENEKFEAFIKKAELISNILDKFENKGIISSLSDFKEKKANLEEKEIKELETLNTFIDLYQDGNLGFGKLASAGKNSNEDLSAEEQFNKIILGGI